MSILDFKRGSLCQDVWGDDNQLLPEVRDFVIESLSNFFESEGLGGFETCIRDIVIGSSLATYYYRSDTDFDIKVVYDEDRFIRENSNMDFLVQTDEFLITKGRESFYTTQFLPGTNHALDFYFYTEEEFYPINYNKYDSLYSFKRGWLSEPRDLPIDQPDFILEVAYEKATPYIEKIVGDVHEAKKNIIDFILFRDYISTLDDDDIQAVYKEFLEQFNKVDESIVQLVDDRSMFKSMRDVAFNKEELESELELIMGSYNYSDENLIFKVIQRYGLMNMLSEIKDLYTKRGLTVDNVDDFMKVV